ncbi:hydrolase, TatD family protein [Plesiocystis pacifica SIR-1]|uniref:Hydrolase, TatD family protein n=1 Tax=Plesiocystis pacifica SIR-1 TaxID=391625 RepID=A6G3W3_9BACT|nr:TatD family hydrolase [Plesiocystis pacifica]EDM79500.1 hydrolase, TatD family protein [Plesiocystis pacifica SIR-1]
MQYFDPHIHMSSRTTDDYQAMAAAGITAVIEPAFWLGQPRTHVGSFEDYFLSLVGWERFRASQFGIRHYCTMGLNSKESNHAALADGVLDLLPIYLEKETVLGVGEIGYDDMTEGEERCFEIQLRMAMEYELPALIHTPHRDKLAGTLRTLELLRRLNFPMELALVDHNTEETIEAVLASGAWAGHTIYPETKMSSERMVELIRKYGTERIMVNSSADWGVSDPLAVPKTADAMRAAGFGEDAIAEVCWNNPVRFYAQSGRLDLREVATTPSIDQRVLFEGNSVLRGQAPRVDNLA